MSRAFSIDIPLITQENRKRFFWPAAFYLYLSYTFTGSYALFTPWHPYVSAVDEWVPFLPGTVWIYLSHIGLLFTGWWWMVRGPACTRAFWAIVLCSIIATFYFFFFPTELPRRTLDSIDAGPLTTAAWAFLLHADHPTNSFPSMHVAEAMITAIGLMRAHPHWGWLAPTWAVCVGISTLTTEQHVLIDVLGGFAVAAFCLWATHRFLNVTATVESPAGETASD